MRYAFDVAEHVAADCYFLTRLRGAPLLGRACGSHRWLPVALPATA